MSSFAMEYMRLVFGEEDEEDDDIEMMAWLFDDDDEIEEMEEHENQIAMIVALVASSKDFKWNHQRLTWAEHVEKELHENSFHKTYRMSYEAYMELLELIRDDVTCSILHSRSSCDEEIYPELVMAIGIRWLAGGSWIDIKNAYHVSPASVYRCRNTFMDAIVDCPALDIKWPSTVDEMNDSARAFYNRSSNGIMRGCVGAVDGLLVKIKTPTTSETNNQRAFFSGHYQHMGLNVQAVCDAKCRFIFFCVAAPGKSSDLRAYEGCSLRELVDSLPHLFYIVGDAAYMLSDRLLTPYTGSQRDNPDQDAYNFYLSQLRIRIEQAFGLLTNKWRVLRRTLETSLENSSLIIEVCARLHNYVINKDWKFVDDDDNEDPLRCGPQRLEPMIQSPLGGGYLPSVEDLEDIPGTSIIREVIVEHIQRNQYRRPAHNIRRRELHEMGLM